MYEDAERAGSGTEKKKKKKKSKGKTKMQKGSKIFLCSLPFQNTDTLQSNKRLNFFFRQM